jgi:hypothetical protein
VSSTARDNWTAADAVAGLLAACALVLGCLELVYRPVRLAPVALLLVLIATVMTRTQQRLILAALAAIGVCFIVGTALQVITHHPLF